MMACFTQNIQSAVILLYVRKMCRYSYVYLICIVPTPACTRYLKTFIYKFQISLSVVLKAYLYSVYCILRVHVHACGSVGRDAQVFKPKRIHHTYTCMYKLRRVQPGVHTARPRLDSRGDRSPPACGANHIMLPQLGVLTLSFRWRF